MSLRPEETKARAAFIRRHHGLGTPHQDPEALAQIAGHPVTKLEVDVSGLPPTPAPGKPEIARARRAVVAPDDQAEPPREPPKVPRDTSDRDDMVLRHQLLISGLADKWRAIGRSGGASGAPVYRPPAADPRTKGGRKIKMPVKTLDQEDAARRLYWLAVGDDYTGEGWEESLRCWPAWRKALRKLPPRDRSKCTFGAFSRPHIDRALQHYAGWDRSLVRRMSDDRGRDVALDAPAPSTDDGGSDDVGADPGTWGDRIALDPDGVGYDAASGDAPNHEEAVALDRIDVEVQRDRVLAALQRQPTADQIAVRRRMDGASFPEIGRALGVTEDGARHRLERATERLRHDMEKDLETRLSGSPAAHVIYAMRREYPSHSNIRHV